MPKLQVYLPTLNKTTIKRVGTCVRKLYLFYQNMNKIANTNKGVIFAQKGKT